MPLHVTLAMLQADVQLNTFGGFSLHAMTTLLYIIISLLCIMAVAICRQH